MINLTRPLVFLDLETTGTDRDNDRIVEIALTRLQGELRSDKHFRSLVNPGRPIPEASTAIHGITGEMVKDAPYFSEIAGEVYHFMLGCDLGGFNSNQFDIPLLYNELARVGIYLNPQAFHMVDAGNLFKIQEARTLSKAVEFYCGHEHTGAHGAQSDVLATVDVFRAQMERYPDLPKSVEEMALYTNYGKKVADLSGKFVYDSDGTLLLNFGKHKGQSARNHLDFVYWMTTKDFAEDTLLLCAVLLGMPQAASDEDGELPW